MNSNLETVRDLRGYLIKKFAFTVALSSIAEYAIISVINQTLIPLIIHAIFKDSTDIETFRTSAAFLAVIMIISTIILNIFSNLVPQSIKLPIESLIDSSNAIISDYFGLSNEARLFTDIPPLTKLLLFLLMLVIAALIISPYLIGGIYFSREVMKKVNVIEAEIVETQKSYERRRNLMLSDIAHDLKTPMTTVSGYAKALEDGMVKDEDKQKYLAAIQTKSKRMNDLIILLFDYIKLDSEGFKLVKQKTDICELARECAAFLYQDIEDAGMELDIDIPEEQIPIELDKIQMTRSINNLLTNAVKHNEAGTKIKLLIYSDEGYVHVAVADSGEVIPSEQAKTIFEPFVMGDESRNSRGGTGLGLSIVQKVMSMHGFRLRLIQAPNISKYHKLDGYNKTFLISIDQNNK